MKCPNCGYNSYNYLDICKRCNTPLNPEGFYGHQIHNSIKKVDIKGKPEIDLSDYVTDLPESYKNKAADNMSENSKEANMNQNDYDSELVVKDEDKFKGIFDKLEQISDEPAEGSENLDTVIIKKRKGFLKNILGFFNRKKHQSKDVNIDEKTVILYNAASFEARLLAFLVDWVLIILLSLTAFVTGIRQINLDYSYDLDGLFIILVQVYLVLLFFASTYFLFLLGYSGKTIGKMLLKIKVVKEDGSDIGFYESAKRWFGYIVSMIPLFLGFLWALFDDKKQSFHDKIANTIVIKTLN